MTEQLYDLYAAPANTGIDGIDTHGTFVMRATLVTIIQFCDAHHDALRRVASELKTGSDLSALHHNGRGRWAGTVHGVTLAVAPLGVVV